MKPRFTIDIKYFNPRSNLSITEKSDFCQSFIITNIEEKLDSFFI